MSLLDGLSFCASSFLDGEMCLSSRWAEHVACLGLSCCVIKHGLPAHALRAFAGRYDPWNCWRVVCWCFCHRHPEILRCDTGGNKGAEPQSQLTVYDNVLSTCIFAQEFLWMPEVLCTHLAISASLTQGGRLFREG